MEFATCRHTCKCITKERKKVRTCQTKVPPTQPPSSCRGGLQQLEPDNQCQETPWRRARITCNQQPSPAGAAVLCNNVAATRRKVLHPTLTLSGPRQEHARACVCVCVFLCMRIQCVRLYSRRMSLCESMSVRFLWQQERMQCTSHF